MIVQKVSNKDKIQNCSSNFENRLISPYNLFLSRKTHSKSLMRSKFKTALILTLFTALTLHWELTKNFMLLRVFVWRRRLVVCCEHVTITIYTVPPTRQDSSKEGWMPGLLMTCINCILHFERSIFKLDRSSFANISLEEK